MLTLPTVGPVMHYIAKPVLLDRSGDDALVIDPAFFGSHDAWAVIDRETGEIVQAWSHESTRETMADAKRHAEWEADRLNAEVNQ
jgi:hypothetical protein